MSSENTKEKDLFEACKNKDNFAVQSCILDGCDPILMQNEFGQSALHVASLHGNMQAVQLLVEIYDCIPTVEDHRGCTAIHLACKGGSLNVTSYLLEMMPGVNYYLHLKDRSGNTILHYACLSGNVSLVRFLMRSEHYYKINVYYDKTLFVEKSYRSNDLTFTMSSISIVVPHYSDILEELLNFKNNNADTALHVSCRAGHLNIIKKFFEEVYQTVHDVSLSTLFPSILRLALKFGRHNISCYLQNRSIPFDTPSDLESKHFHSGRCNHMHFDIPGPRLCNECMYDDQRRFQQVPYTTSTNNIIPWSLPCVSSLNLACRNARNADHHTVKFLIRAHKYDPKQGGVLHSACVSNNVGLVTYLVSECGCDPNLCNVDGNTALHEACKWGCLSIVKFFINRDPAILNIKNAKNETPLHLACFHSRVLIIM